MKKILSILLAFMMVYSFSSCADSDYTDKYRDPSKTTVASCDRLMTGVFYTGNEFTYNSYWRMFTWENGGVSKYAQTVGFSNTNGSRYGMIDRYSNARWLRFYNVLTQYRELERTFNNLPDMQKPVNRIYCLVAEIFIYDHLAQLIDAFGDVPFSEAGYLTITGDLQSSYPRYDKQTALYEMMLDNLGKLYQELRDNTFVTTNLEAQDFINKGNLKLWEKYCNSLRLRLATRVASQGELADKGKQVIQEILNGNYPLVDNITENIQVLSDDAGESSTDGEGGFNYGDAFRTGFVDHRAASQSMLDVLQTEETLGMNDPRLAVMYSTNGSGEYVGLSPREPLGQQEANTANKEAMYAAYAQIDSTTIIYNRNLKSPIVTASEVYFNKAEAYQKGWATGSAKDAFVNGVVESVKFYYDLNNTANNRLLTETPIKRVPMPAESDVIAFANAMWDNATNKEEVIAVQKWLNFGYMQGAQAWNEVRRTGYPDLYFSVDTDSDDLQTPPERIIYPSSERDYNTANYQAQVATMANGDDYRTKLFWAK